MNAKQTYLKGKSIFIVSLLVIGTTIVTVYLTGESCHRDLSANLYLSLAIIASILFLFMTYGLYKGIGLIDNFPKFKKFKSKSLTSNLGTLPDMPGITLGDGIGGIVLSIIAWIFLFVLFVVLLIALEAIFWVSLSIILGMLYWVFFRALKLVFTKSAITKGNLGLAAAYAFGHTTLYIGWIFGIVYLTQLTT